VQAAGSELRKGRLTKDEARRIATNVAKLLTLSLRKVVIYQICFFFPALRIPRLIH
jgi:hypothetical protein